MHRHRPPPLATLLCLVALTCIVGGTACRREEPAPARTGAEGASGSAATAASTSSGLLAASGAGVPPAADSLVAEPRRALAPTLPPALEPSTFARLMAELSEPDQYFFSTNTVSNETSYLQVASELEQVVRPGRAYLGVGPEQNFTYIALSRPTIAFIVDIRRQNALLHLLHKAAFERARTRAHFVTLLLGRPYLEPDDPGPDAGLEAVLAHAVRLAPDEQHFAQLHTELVAHIETRFEVDLSSRDREQLLATHRDFFTHQLDVRFELAESGRNYPPWREILALASPDGRQLGFLASEAAFRFVQELQRRHRIIPVVGDFAGVQALQGIARELRRRNTLVSVFYVSNVEQYLMDPPKWKGWIRNVEALPRDGSTLLLRCYLDQGRSHPLQLAGHRTTTVLQSMDAFLTRQHEAGFGSFWQVVTHQLLHPSPP